MIRNNLTEIDIIKLLVDDEFTTHDKRFDKPEYAVLTLFSTKNLDHNASTAAKIGGKGSK